MQIFELTQKRRLNEYDPNRLPPKKNYGSGVGPGVQPQYTATPRMKGAPKPGAAPQLPPPSAAQEPPYIDAPAQLTGPAARPQIGTTYDPNVIDVDAREKPDIQALLAPANAQKPSSYQATRALQSYGDVAEIPPEPITPVSPTPAVGPAPSTNPKPAAGVAPAPSTPGVQGSRMGAIVGALGQRLNAYNAARAGLNVPDTGSNQPYGDQRAAAARAAAPLISQQARQEMAKWNQGLMQAVQQAGASSPAQLPTATKQVLARSLMNQVYTNFLQGRLGKKYKELPQYVDGKVQREAAAQVAKLDNAIKAILNFNAPVSNAETQLQRWQDLSQATYDIRSLLQYHPKKMDYTAGKKMPVVQPTANGLRIGSYSLDPKDLTDMEILKLMRELRNKITGALPTISMTPTGQLQIGNYPLNVSDPRDAKLARIIKAQRDQLNSTPVTESLSWSRGFDPSRTLLKKIKS